MRTISIGKQDFASLRERDNFYVDKTAFLKEWWEAEDEVTLITRPRRFGKTLNMSMVECFFSNKYKGREDLFEGLSVWKEEKYRQLQGTYPVIFLTFADVKANYYEGSRQQICATIAKLYEKNRYLLDGELLSPNEKELYNQITMNMDDALASKSLLNLADYLNRYYGRKVIILLDEYDTPLQEAYVGGYWEELAVFTRSLFNSTFKSNPYLERAIMTGITRISKESVFSDLNNLMVVTTTSNQYADAFGFTEEEVLLALDEAGMSGEMDEVRAWYDGFVFGKQKDIYNPWSITNFLKFKELSAYWADTSSNALVNTLIQSGTAGIKQRMEDLLDGGSVHTSIDEQIIFKQLDGSEKAVWSLLLASGYVKVDSYTLHPRTKQKQYSLTLTNFEVQLMFEKMIALWFDNGDAGYHDFVRALLQGDLKAMNHYMNKVALSTFSSFDVGSKPSERSEPERFYHGFVLGLMVDRWDDYMVSSNRESGFGRYDVVMEPKKPSENRLPAIILEFKVYDAEEEKTLEDTVRSAHAQIEEKNYDVELLKRGIPQDRIRHYGFAFRGKTVLIG